MSNPRCCTACNRPTMQHRQGLCSTCLPEADVTDPVEVAPIDSQIRLSRQRHEDPLDLYAYLAA